MKNKTISLLLSFLLGFFLILILSHTYVFYRSSLDTFTSKIISTNNYSNYDNKLKKDMDFYVISMKNPERMENIERQLEKLKQQGTPIHLEFVDAVVGKELDLNQLIKDEVLSPNHTGNGELDSNFRRGEIGCYMSHLKIYQQIQEKNKSGYSIIFEDDFDISSERLIEDIEKIIKKARNQKIDFDILFLGTVTENHGEPIFENIHRIDKNSILYGTHALLLKNENIPRWIEHIKMVDKQIDIKLVELTHHEKVNSYVIYPHIVNQQWGKIESSIAIEGFDILSNSKIQTSVLND
jgi:hypothetical protein